MLPLSFSCVLRHQASFDDYDGAVPTASLVQGMDRNFYGTILDCASAFDPNIFAGAVAVLACVALLASYLPTRSRLSSFTN